MRTKTITQFKSGTHNILNNEIIPVDAAQDSVNWTTQDGKIMLSYGRFLVGDRGTAGKVRSVWPGYKVDSTRVIYRKKGTVIQYLNGSTWTDVITGLTESHEYMFQNYSSLAGSFTFAIGRGGIFKMHNANPGSYMNMYDAAKNFKCKGIIDKGRMLAFDIENDPTGLRGSFIDAQNSTTYTSVANEVVGTGNGSQTVFTGTLAFKGSNPLANCFGLSLNMNPSGITATDNYLGVISGTGVTGTINYITGAFSLTFSAPVAGATQIRISYQWENSNNKGVTDFTYSATRLAGEGFVLRQDEGGDMIMKVLLGLDGSYYSIKQYSVYKLTLDNTDTKPENLVYRKDLGIPNWQAATSTGRGIIFMNTANPARPQLTVLERNPLGDNTIATILLPHYRFDSFDYSECVLEPFQQFIVISCKNPGSTTNDVLLLCDIELGTVDKYNYRVQSMCRDQGILYIGDTITENVFSLFDGFDDDGEILTNYWDSKADLLGVEDLKKVRRARFQGNIDVGQVMEVYLATDDGSFDLVGTIRGDSGTVSPGSSGMVGASMTGETMVGGSGDSSSTVGKYFFELKLRTGKFRKRALRFKAIKYGYVDVTFVEDWDIMTFEGRIPTQFRRKQNVSLDGISTDQPS